MSFQYFKFRRHFHIAEPPLDYLGAAGWKRQPAGGFIRLGGSPVGTSLNAVKFAASGSDVASKAPEYKDVMLFEQCSRCGLLDYLSAVHGENAF